MRKTTRTVAAAPALAGMSLLLAACGGGGSHAATSAGSPSGASAPTTAAAGSSSMMDSVHVATVGGLGRVLVDGSGRTLYLLTSDHQSTPTCKSGNGCTTYWPPLLAHGSGQPAAGSGADAMLLGHVSVAGEGTQVTYDHWPLYTYSGDSGTGQSNGEGIKSFGGTWYAVSPSGHPVMGAGGGSSPTTSYQVYGY